MDKLKKALAEADDEYLIGISNKGIVKRAYKDMETADINTGFVDKSAEVTVDSAQCIVKVPISESRCSCPSRTICRHIITAVLWLKKELLTNTPEEKQTGSENHPVYEPKESRLVHELTEYPVDKLKKAMKKQYYNSFLEKAKVGAFPQMDEGSTVTADIYEENVTVKLLSPLEYSACTCHSRELCKHKAAVILAWKLKHKVVTLKDLAPVEDAVSVDEDRLKTCAVHCTAFLERLLSDGLVRTSDDAAEFAEANALICHTAGASDGEKLLREIGNRLRAYTVHSPEFSTESLFFSIMDAYLLMSAIINETEPEKLGQISGKFRSSYTITDNLELIPLAQRKFSSMTGYEGDIYYFINKNRNVPPFLTYSDIRPAFYENNRRNQQSNAPWGLYGTCSSLMKFEMRLVLPKLSGIKLSSSNTTQAYQICKPKLDQQCVYDKIYTDFRKLIEDNFIHTDKDYDSETLVMLMPEKCISSTFSEIEQTHTIVVEDFCSQRLSIKARYKSKTRFFFEQLAIVGQTMLEKPQKNYVIFGNAYIENGQCNIYPIAVFDNIAAPVPPHEEREIQYSGTYSYFLRLFHDIMNIICEMTECGLNSYDLYMQLSDNAEECERSGLAALSEKLRKLTDLLYAKNHTYSNDNTNIIRLICELYSYLKNGIEKTNVKCAIENLYKRGEDENEFAG